MKKFLLILFASMSTLSCSKEVRAILDNVSADDFTKVEEYIVKDGNINVKGKYSRTILMWAAYYGNFETLKFLIDSGANIELQDQNGVTALM